MNYLFKVWDTRCGASSNQESASSIQYPVSSIPAEAGSPLHSDQHPAAGFTLLEILLAFLILTFVITALMGSFNSVFSTTDTLKNSGKYYEMAKNCLNRMTDDLDGLFVVQPPLYKKREFEDPPDPYRIVGSNSDVNGTSFADLRFASSAHIPLDKVNRTGIAEIVYYVQAQNDGQPVLKRADHLYPYPPFEKSSADPILCQNVKSLAFKYYNDEGEASEVWDSDSDQNGYATPTAVGIQLEIGTESKSYTFETTVRLAVYRKKMD